MVKIGDLKHSAKEYFPAVTIERYFGDFGNGLFSFIIVGGTVVFGIVSTVSLITLALSDNDSWLGDFSKSAVLDFGEYFHYIYGLFFLFLSAELVIRSVKAFHDSYAFSDLRALTIEEDEEPLPKITYESAPFILSSLDADSVSVFLGSPSGAMTFGRLGIREADVRNFLRGRVKPVLLRDLTIKTSTSKPVNFRDLAEAIVSADNSFLVFLTSRKVSAQDFLGAASWAEYILREIRIERRWWSRYRLGRIPGIGKDWAYGEIPNLTKFARPINETSYYRDASNVLAIRRDSAEQLEKVLSRISGANALIVAETNEEAMGVVSALGFMIKEGSAMPQIEHKQMFVLDYVTLIETTKEKSLFEAAMMSALSDSAKAGNIIIVINDLPALLASASTIGSNVLSIFEWYFDLPDINIIVTANSQGFHAVIENNGSLMRRLEKVLVEGVSGTSLLNYLMHEALRIESKAKVLFMYQAVREGAESAERFFFGANSEDKAADLLIESATALKSSGVKIVGREDIMRLVEVETGIPRKINEVNTDNSILLNLEKILSERVVGQSEAITAVSGAMRRAHAGIGNPSRPLGSFLFLGPTGVGKTETTKALADAFFGGESAIIRLDMSEYRTADALERLIGNFSIGKPGILSSALRDKPYGVLLLDEFEKTSKDVLDLFLQVLDEGIFSDMSGKRVSARNLIIIATSNAGSEFICKTVKQSGSSRLNKDEIISAIIDEEIFKPELLNRFDGVILFHPLDRISLVKIAGLMLKKLNRRLAEKGLELEVTPELVNALVEKGADPTFGARPMNRAIQDKVEKIFFVSKFFSGEGPPSTKKF